MTCWPIALLIAGEISRAMRSSVPPGGARTINRNGFEGNDCANATSGANKAHAHSAVITLQSVFIRARRFAVKASHNGNEKGLVYKLFARRTLPCRHIGAAVLGDARTHRGFATDRIHMLRSMPLKFVAAKTRGSTYPYPLDAPAC